MIRSWENSGLGLECCQQFPKSPLGLWHTDARLSDFYCKLLIIIREKVADSTEIMFYTLISNIFKVRNVSILRWWYVVVEWFAIFEKISVCTLHCLAVHNYKYWHQANVWLVHFQDGGQQRSLNCYKTVQHSTVSSSKNANYIYA